MESVPGTPKLAVVRLATPPASDTPPSLLLPLKKITLPVGVPPPGGTALTVAVKVTDCPELDGFCEEIREVVVEASLTTCASTADVLAAKFESPGYFAVILSVPPVASVEIVKVAVPPANVPVPNTLVPCRNVTVSPLGGAPAFELTFAVKVTGCP